MIPSRSLRSASRRQQGGAILVFAVLGLSLAVILLSIADIGFLYYYKREYQKSADLAAIAGAKRLISSTGIRSCTSGAQPAATANAAQNLGSKSYTIVVTCGKWNPTGNTRFDTTVPADEQDAVQAVISGTPPTFLPFVGPTLLSARAIALADQPVAALAIRSTLAVVDSNRSSLLNSVVGNLLGGSVNLSVAAWNGIVNTNINLLQYLDALALNLGIDAGNYDQVLGADVTLGQLLGAAVDALNRGGGTGDVSAALGGLAQLLNLNLPGFTPLLHLGDLLNIQTGTPASGLDMDLDLLDLVQGSVQLANSQCSVCATLPIALPGVANVDVRVRVTEPPQLSSIGNPALAAADPLGADRIFVRTAQVRTLISVDLPIAGSVLNGLQALLTNPLVSSITNTVNSLLSLNIVDLLSALLPIPTQKDIIDIKVLPSPRLDLNLDAGAGQAYVNAYDCSNAKSLTVPVRTAAAELRIGSMGTSATDAANKVFSSTSPPTVDPIPLIDIGTYHVKQTCLLLLCSVQYQTASGGWSDNISQAKRNAFAGGGIGIKADTPVAGTNSTQTYTQPPTGGLPDLGEDPAWKSVTSTNIVNSLSSTLTGLQFQLYPPSGTGIGSSGLGNVLYLVGSVVNTLVASLSSVISVVLSPLLDPLVNLLLSGLGIDVNKVDVGANMTCQGGGATLVD